MLIGVDLFETSSGIRARKFIFAENLTTLILVFGNWVRISGETDEQN